MYRMNLSIKINLRLSSEQYDRLCLLSAKRNIKVSELIRYIIDDYLRKFK